MRLNSPVRAQSQRALDAIPGRSLDFNLKAIGSHWMTFSKKNGFYSTGIRAPTTHQALWPSQNKTDSDLTFLLQSGLAREVIGF